MLYDLASGPPKPGSLLESVFIFMAKRRQEAEYFKTKTLIAASIATSLKEGGKLLDESLDQYRSIMFPFLSETKKKLDKDTKAALKQWTNKVLKIRPLWRAHENKPLISRLRKGAEKVKKAEELRRQRQHRRI